MSLSFFIKGSTSNKSYPDIMEKVRLARSEIVSSMEKTSGMALELANAIKRSDVVVLGTPLTYNQSIIAKNENSDEYLTFYDEDDSIDEMDSKQYWDILIVDDEESVDVATRMVLRDLVFENRRLRFFTARNVESAIKIIDENPNISIILLDIVMESDDAGLKIIKYVRDTIGNKKIRIILRTGQPGAAPEKDIVLNYDINDYKTKTELTSLKLITTVIVSLRNYKDLTEK